MSVHQNFHFCLLLKLIFGLKSYFIGQKERLKNESKDHAFLLFMFMLTYTRITSFHLSTPRAVSPSLEYSASCFERVRFERFYIYETEPELNSTQI